MMLPRREQLKSGVVRLMMQMPKFVNDARCLRFWLTNSTTRIGNQSLMEKTYQKYQVTSNWFSSSQNRIGKTLNELRII